MKKDNFNARVRNYSSARQAALSDNNIPESVYDNLVSTINEQFTTYYIDMSNFVKKY